MNLRKQFLDEFDLHQMGSGSAKQVYCKDTDLERVVVLFDKALDVSEAFVEALLECFWSHLLFQNNILPHNPEWCIHFYTGDASAEQKTITACSRALSSGNADQLARDLETAAMDTATREQNSLVYCTTTRAQCDMHQWCQLYYPSSTAMLCALRQILAQLQAMHALDIVHGDVKCTNILILDHHTGLAQLCDFTLCNKQALVKPLHTGEDSRWLRRQGGTYQLNLRCTEETPLQYGIRNDWLALCLISVKVRALVDSHHKAHLAQSAYDVEKKFWHTARATKRDYAQLKQLVDSMASSATNDHTKAASEIAQIALQRAKPPKQSNI